MAAPRIVTLTTDFGLRDAYVAIMKAVILEIAQDVCIVDISHEIEPQNILEGAYVLAYAAPYFPQDAVHVAVIDPGVGTTRKPIAVRGVHGTFVGPDNGVLEPALRAQGAVPEAGGETNTVAVELSNPRFQRLPVSGTFHGRDIFGPAAAHIVRGVPLESFGPPVTSLRAPDHPDVLTVGDVVDGSVVYIDRFGNCITNLRPEHLPAAPVFEVGGTLLRGLAGDYQAGDVVALVGSSGAIEIAARNGDASAVLGLGVGDVIRVRSER